MVFVTGGTGLLGSHLLIELTKQKKHIRCLYRNEQRIANVQHVFEFYLRENWKQYFDCIEWVLGDILDVCFLQEQIDEGSEVYHCAALVSFDENKFNTLLKINREGTANMVNVCLERSVRKFCYVSSTAALGDDGNPIMEDTRWKKTPRTSAYSISKYSAEKEVWRGVEEGLNTIIVNPCVILGPGNWSESSLLIFKNAQRGMSHVPSGANATVDARDVAEIMVKLMEADISAEQFLCIGSNQSFKHLISEIADKLGLRKPTKILSLRMANTIRVLMGIGYFFSSKSAPITKDTIANMYAIREYSNAKVCERLNFEFRTLEETIDNAIKGRYYSK